MKSTPRTSGHENILVLLRLIFLTQSPDLVHSLPAVSKTRGDGLSSVHFIHSSASVVVATTAVAPNWRHGSRLLSLRQSDGGTEKFATDAEDLARSSFILRRRQYLALLPAILTPFPRGGYPPISRAAEPETAPGICDGGALAAEQPVPGAYEQTCMQLNSRLVPIHVTLADRSTKTTWLSLQQGMAGAGNTGMAVWNSSLLLVRVLEAVQASNESFFQGLDLAIELGCGTGLASLATSFLGAPRVLATDGNPNVLRLASENLANQAQHISGSVRAVDLSWGLLNAIDYAETADLVLGSDLTYNAGTWRALAETMETILKTKGSILYLTLGHAGFNVKAELQGFVSVTQVMGLVQVFPTDATWPFPGLVSSQSFATNKWVQDMMTPQELLVAQASGGVGVVVLQKKRYAET